MGIKFKDLELIKSFIENRTSSTYVNNMMSTTLIQKHGVPQGSTLAPLFFNIYVNDIFDNVSNEMILFADDSTSIIYADSLDLLENEVNKFMHELFIWTEKNKIFINIEKTKYRCYRKVLSYF